MRACIVVAAMLICNQAAAQQNSATHTRGKLWETLYNMGFIGDGGAWDYLQVTGIGFYPGFDGYNFPDNEIDANGYITDANFHNFRSGPWIIAKNAQTLVPPDFHAEPRDFLIYHASLATGDFGVLTDIAPFVTTRNFIGAAGFNPLVPEEVNYCWWQTSTGITVKQRSMAFSYPGYQDFIIYDQTYVNTGDIALPSVNRTEHLDQTLNEVWVVFHSGIQVSTKGALNFHYDPGRFEDSAAPAGGFGWHPGAGYTDYYAVENDGVDGNGLLYYSRDFNGGREPAPWDQFRQKTNWQEALRLRPEWLPELQDPACFGFVFLYRTPPASASSADPFEADPAFFNIYSDEGDKFQGKTVDFEGFGLASFNAQQIYDFASHSKLPPNNGNLYCWYTSSFGPYTLAPGDSVRLIFAEVAGTLDLREVVRGDPNHFFPDSSIAAIRRNANAARNAVRWGFGAAPIGNVQYVADAPEPPPAPNCTATNAAVGADTAIIAVRWDKLAEETVITDGASQVFYDGANDLSGYRVFRGFDKRSVWDLIADIPRVELSRYWRPEISRYEFLDKSLQFGNEYYYYVQAYSTTPRSWTSANGTVVSNLPELRSDDYNRTPLTTARPGPFTLQEKSWDVFAVPNPYVEGDAQRSFGGPNPQKIEFRNLPENATIKIFSLSGDLIRTLNHGPDALGNLYGSLSWDQRSDSGLVAAAGLYIYVVQSNTPSTSGSRTAGKLMIIR